eukprot:TRINITY_DN5107_c0_g1_i3.p2 TRINITY_DN5107_c0_g1~~TRINITY_DN5107_c0_g1_i3.p2  ORF type:complete len:1049 (-),score=133.75 TRINITY_DN5107_c0_g1_i3:79-3225(-)
MPLEALSQVVVSVPPKDENHFKWLEDLKIVSKSFQSMMNEKIVWKMLCSKRWNVDESKLMAERERYSIPFNNTVIDWNRYYLLRDLNDFSDVDLTNWENFYGHLVNNVNCDAETLIESSFRFILISFLMIQIYYENKQRVVYTIGDITDQKFSDNLFTPDVTGSVSWEKGTSSSEKIICCTLLYLSKLICFLSCSPRLINIYINQTLKLFEYSTLHNHHNLTEVCDLIMFRILNSKEELSEYNCSRALAPLFHRVCQIDSQDWTDLDDKREVKHEIVIIKEQFGSKTYSLFKKYVEKGMDSDDWKQIFGSFIVLSLIVQYDDNKLCSFTRQSVFKYMHDSRKEIRWASTACLFQLLIENDEIKSEYASTFIPKVIKSINDPCPEIVSSVLSSICDFLDYSIVKNYETELIDAIKKTVSKPEVPSRNFFIFLQHFASLLDKKFMKYYSEIVDVLKVRLNYSYEKGDVSASVDILGALGTLVILFIDVDTDNILSILGSLTEKLKEHPLPVVSRIFKIWNTIITRIGHSFSRQMDNLAKVFEKYYPILSEQAFRYCTRDTSATLITNEEEKERALVSTEDTIRVHSKLKCFLEVPGYEHIAIVNKPLIRCKKSAMEFLVSVSQFPQFFVNSLSTYVDLIIPQLDTSVEQNTKIRMKAMNSLVLSFEFAHKNLNQDESQQQLFRTIFDRIFNAYNTLISSLNLEAFLSESDFEENVNIFTTFTKILELSPQLSNNQIKDLAHLVLKLIMLLSFSDGQCLDDPNSVTLENLYNITSSMVDMFEPMIKKYYSNLGPMVEHICVVGTTALSVSSRLLCICLLDDFLDSDDSLIKKYNLLQPALKTLISNSPKSFEPLVQASVYGLGSLMKQLSSEEEKKSITTILETLVKILKYAENGNVIDNTCSSIFKGFHYHPDIYDKNKEAFEVVLKYASKMCTDIGEIKYVVTTLVDMYQNNWNNYFNDKEKKRILNHILDSLKEHLQEDLNSESDDIEEKPLTDVTHIYVSEEYNLDKSKFDFQKVQRPNQEETQPKPGFSKSGTYDHQLINLVILLV